MANVLHLNDVELDAIRGLQAGANQLPPEDPIWEELRDIGLVEACGTRVRVWMLTLPGRIYRTG